MLLLALLLPWAQPRAEVPVSPWSHQTEDGATRVNLYLFWSTSCPHCQRAIRFVDDLDEKLPWLDVVALELSDPANVALYQNFAEALQVEAAYVPAFFYCGGMFHGYDTDETTGQYLRDTLGQCHAELTAAEPAPTSTAPDQPPIELPLVGQLDPATLSLPMTTLVLAGLDAFNPCAFFVLLFLLSLIIHVQSRLRMALVGGVFVVFSGLLYFLFMAAWLNLFLLVGHLSAVTIAAGLIAIAVGAINVKDYVWLRRGVSLSIPERAKPGLYQRTRRLVAASSLPAMLVGTIALALAANAYELLCTAGFPLVFTRILTLHDLTPATYYLYLALYNLIYVFPLLAIVVVVIVTLGAHKLSEQEGRVLKLLSGLMMLGLGTVLLLAPEWLNQPLTAVALIGAAVVVTAVIVWLGRATARMRRAAP